MPKLNPAGFLSIPFKIFSALGNISAIAVLILVIFIGLGLVTARSKVLTVLDSVDKELYKLEDTTLEGTLEVTEGVTVGTVLPVGEVVQKLNEIPDSIPIDTQVPLNTQTNLDTDLKFDTTLPIDTTSSSSIELPPLGSLETISIPIETMAPLKTTVPIDSTLPINAQLPLSFDIPIDDDLKLAMDSDLDLETTLPIYTEIPMKLDLAKTNVPNKLKGWHEILNQIRGYLLASPKSREDFDLSK